MLGLGFRVCGSMFGAGLELGLTVRGLGLRVCGPKKQLRFRGACFYIPEGAFGQACLSFGGPKL